MRRRLPRWVGTALIVFGVFVNGLFGVLMLIGGDAFRGIGQLCTAIAAVYVGLAIRRRDDDVGDT